ncbi:hypothetical protein LJB90_02185 [Eubacteriales bacterium OttesenSCG-928-G02]|nr:hypothetical protein [Eubacteriales bacterium OttesenSCG-928-G02]
MNYIDISVDLLKRKQQLTNAKSNLEDELLMLENEKFSTRHRALSDPSVAEGGGNKYEEHLVNLIVLIDNAYFRKKVVERELKMIENGLNSLSEYEVDLLDCFYMSRVKDPLGTMINKYYKEKSSINADKRVALEKFTRSVYGLLSM